MPLLTRAAAVRRLQRLSTSVHLTHDYLASTATSTTPTGEHSSSRPAELRDIHLVGTGTAKSNSRCISSRNIEPGAGVALPPAADLAEQLLASSSALAWFVHLNLWADDWWFLRPTLGCSRQTPPVGFTSPSGHDGSVRLLQGLARTGVAIMANPAADKGITRATTRPFCSIPTATTSRRCFTGTQSDRHPAFQSVSRPDEDTASFDRLAPFSRSGPARLLVFSQQPFPG